MAYCLWLSCRAFDSSNLLAFYFLHHRLRLTDLERCLRICFLMSPAMFASCTKADNGTAAEEGVSDLAVSMNSLAASYFHHPTPHETQLKCSSPLRASS